MKNKNLNKLANFIILYCINRDVSINSLKLQKLLYYIQVWHITLLDKNPMFDELPQAWASGPIYKSVYNTYTKKRTKSDIFSLDLDKKELSKKLSKSLTDLGLTKDTEELLFAVLDNYSIMSDEKLVFLTHSQRPWNDARKGLSPIEYSENQISIDSIYDYYSTKLKK